MLVVRGCHDGQRGSSVGDNDLRQIHGQRTIDQERGRSAFFRLVREIMAVVIAARERDKQVAFTDLPGVILDSVNHGPRIASESRRGEIGSHTGKLE